MTTLDQMKLYLKKIKSIMYRADDIYQRVGLVKNVIDLMGDFATQGIRIVHRNKRVERFYKRWFEKNQW